MRDPFQPIAGEQPRGYRLVLRLLLLYLLSSLSPAVTPAEVAARIDRTTITLNETLHLSLESDTTQGSRPDLSVLAPDFEILDRHIRHDISVVAGRRTERRLLILKLRPRHIGQLKIPPIHFGAATTQALQVSVTAPPQGTPESSIPDTSPTGTEQSTPAPTLILEVGLSPSKGYLRQQFVLTAKVFLDGPVGRMQLYDPQIPNAGILPLGEDRYGAEREGRSLRVYERRYAIFPREPGRLEVPPLVVEGWTGGGGELYPLPGYGSPPTRQQVRALSEGLSGEVLPPPAGTGKKDWLPAHGLRLTESGPAIYRTHAGQPIERRIHLRADGIMAQDLPTLSLSAPYQITSRPGQPQLWDERRPGGVLGNRREIVTLTAQEPGHYQLPPLRLDWWNTATGQWETATLPARDLVISAAPTNDSALPPPTVGSSLQPRQQPSRADTSELTTLHYPTGAGTRQDGSAVPGGLWIWLAIAFALAWITTMMGWWRSRKAATAVSRASISSSSLPASGTIDPIKSAIEAVRVAYQAKDPGAARAALLAWAGQVFPDQTPSNLARLAQRCPQPLRDRILLLEEAFFSPIPIAWDKQPVWEGLEDFVPTPPEEPASFRRGRPIRRRAAIPDAD